MNNTITTITGYLSFIAAAGATTPTSPEHAQQLFADIHTARSRIITLVTKMADAAIDTAEAQLIATQAAIGNT